MVDPQSGCWRQRGPACSALSLRPYMCLLVDEMCYVIRMEGSRTRAAGMVQEWLLHVIVTEVEAIRVSIKGCVLPGAPKCLFERGKRKRVDDAMMSSDIEI